jgi:molybdate transport system substrate-binding protein
MRKLLLIFAVVAFMSCQPRSSKDGQTGSPELIVAAAANLTEAFAEVGTSFTHETGIPVVFSFGATADLAKQIENGAPFDVFASADTAHVEQLERAGLLTPGTRATYARGRLVVWIPPGSNLKVERLEDLTAKTFERIAVGKPDVAPYGQAAVESLRAVGIWNQVEPKIIYAQNISQAKQYAATGNAEIAFIPLALVQAGAGNYLEVKESLHQPINQALGIIRESQKQEAARRFVDFLLSQKGEEIMLKRGYNKPGQ